MEIKNALKSSGKISSILLVLAVAIVIVIIIVFVVIRINAARNTNNTNTTDPVTVIEEPKPVYEITIGDIRFILESARDMGNILVADNYQENLTTTERFIKVIVGAQNKSKINTRRGAWDLGNIIDSEGRNFISIDVRTYAFLPRPNLCSTLLKPEFEPVPCVRFYEVSKESDGLKLEVGFMSANSSKMQKGLLDLPISPIK